MAVHTHLLYLLCLPGRGGDPNPSLSPILNFAYPSPSPNPNPNQGEEETSPETVKEYTYYTLYTYYGCTNLLYLLGRGGDFTRDGQGIPTPHQGVPTHVRDAAGTL